ncbi:hypothetical protein ACFLIM_40730 [Nonomuraea sp. M3C6]|uniref:Uncharacterized protein n=1 Tax=Nonomuraea marmarensis TaxID=3351344 RepID=A0ABW7AR85_9ACTN
MTAMSLIAGAWPAAADGEVVDYGHQEPRVGMHARAALGAVLGDQFGEGRVE